VEQTQVCNYCSTKKSFFAFTKHKQCTNGLRKICKSCEYKKSQVYYAENKNKILERNQAYRDINGMWYNKSVEHRLRYVIQLGKQRAKKKNIAFNLDLPFLLALWEKQNGECAYSGVPLEYRDNHPHTVSLDRIDSSKEYTEDNVQLVCTIVNYIKQRFEEKAFFNFCLSVAQNNEHRIT
jgi:hypothetical protein